MVKILFSLILLFLICFISFCLLDSAAIAGSVFVSLISLFLICFISLLNSSIENFIIFPILHFNCRKFPICIPITWKLFKLKIGAPDEPSSVAQQ